MSRETWIEETNKELIKLYGITLADCADDRRIDACLSMAPDEFADWVGEKYDLQRLERQSW